MNIRDLTSQLEKEGVTVARVLEDPRVIVLGDAAKIHLLIVENDEATVLSMERRRATFIWRGIRDSIWKGLRESSTDVHFEL